VDYVCIHPGARAAARRWSAERFATVADGLVAAGLQVVLTERQRRRSPQPWRGR
jgi:ADP-heptose:LPS heptosyltransferase